jgi:hypothetical protein
MANSVSSVVIAVPLTGIVLTIWRVCYMDARSRLVDQLEPSPEGEHDYMRWKMLPQTMRRRKEKRKERKAVASRETASDV